MIIKLNYLLLLLSVIGASADTLTIDNIKFNQMVYHISNDEDYANDIDSYVKDYDYLYICQGKYKENKYRYAYDYNDDEKPYDVVCSHVNYDVDNKINFFNDVKKTIIQNTNIFNNVCKVDTFYIPNGDDFTTCAEISFAYKKTHIIKNEKPVFIFAAKLNKVIIQLPTNETNTRNYIEESKPFYKSLDRAGDLYKRNILCTSYLIYDSCMSVLDTSSLFKYLNVSIKTNATNNINAIKEDIRKKLPDYLKKEYPNESDTLTLLQNKINLLTVKYNDIMKNALMIYGEVVEKDGSTLHVYGKTEPFMNILKHDDIPGSINYDEQNILIEGHTSKNVEIQFGNAIKCGPYFYKTKSIGVNAFGAPVTIRHYYNNNDVINNDALNINKLNMAVDALGRKISYMETIKLQ